MRRLLGAVVCVGLLAGCGLLPGGEGGIGWPMPGSDPGVAATAESPVMGTLDTSALTFSPRVEGTIVDQYGAAMVGVVLCVGPSEAGAMALGETDANGAYSVSLDADAMNSGSLLVHKASHGSDLVGAQMMAREMDVQVLVFGHIHRPVVEKGDRLLICPGSPTQPRMSAPSAAMLDITGDRISGSIVPLGSPVCDYLKYAKKLAKESERRSTSLAARP